LRVVIVFNTKKEMKTLLFLLTAFLGKSTTPQTLTDASPAWNYGNYPTGMGTEAKTLAPVGQHISRIDIYRGSSGNGDIGGI